MKEQEIRESLMEQLRSMGADVSHFVSLVDDYVWMWGQMQEMEQDVRERGRHYTAVSAAGKDYEKDNPAVRDAVMYNKQMLALLKELGLSTGNCPGGEDDQL